MTTVVLILIFRKSEDDAEYDKNDDGETLNKYYTPGWTETYDKTCDYKRDKEVLDNAENRKIIREFEKKVEQMIRNTIFYAIFLVVLFIAAYSKTNTMAFNYQAILKSNFKLDTPKFNNVSFFCMFHCFN